MSSSATVIAITPRKLRDSPMNAHVANPTAAERTLARQFAEREQREPSAARAAAFARFAAAGLPTRRVEAWHYTDLRASMAEAAPILAAPKQADLEAARNRLSGRERFVVGPQVVLVGGRFIAELSDPLPAGVSIVGGIGRGARGRRSPGRSQRGVEPVRVHNLGRAGCQASRSRSRFCILATGLRPTLSIRGRLSCSTRGRRRRSSKYSKARMQASSETPRRF